MRRGERGGRASSLEAEGFAHMKPRDSDSLAAKVRLGLAGTLAQVCTSLGACCLPCFIWIGL